MKRYTYLFFKFISFKFKSAMEYRLNFLVQMSHGPAYVLVLFLLLNTALTHSQNLGGWSKAEGMILFSSFQILYTLGIFTFIGGVKKLMWSGIRLGELDSMLLKPINTQFLALFFYPEIEHILLLLILVMFFLYSLIQVWSVLTLLNTILFLIAFVIGFLIIYFVISTYATVGFRVVKAQQVIELFDKVSDFAHYPLSIFPKSIGLLFFTLVPAAFYSYIPASLLLGKGSPWWILGSVIFLVITIIINQWAWKSGLRKYSSASS